MDNRIVPETAIVKKKPKPIARWIILGLALFVIVAGIVAAIITVRHYNSPMLAAKDYYRSVANKEWDKLYEMLEVGEDGRFLTKSAYFTVMEEQFRDMEDYSVQKLDNQLFRMDYVINGRTHSTTIRLNEQAQRRYGLFKQYTIQPVDLLAEDISIIVPWDVNVSLNGVELGSEYLDTGSSVSHAVYEKVYTLPILYIGTYTITQSGENYQTCTEEAEIMASDVVIRPELPYLGENVIQTLGEEATGLIRLEYENMISGNGNAATGGNSGIGGGNSGQIRSYGDVNVSDISTEITEYGYIREGLKVTIIVKYRMDTSLLTQLVDEYTDVNYYRESQIASEEERTYSFVYKNRNWLLCEEE